MIPRIGEWVKRNRGRGWAAVCLVLVGWSAYNLGLLRAQRGDMPAQQALLFRDSATDVPRPSPTGQGRQPRQDRTDPRVVASKSSKSKKYHYSWCPGAQQIKESNRLWFPTATDAQASGYSLAGNCSQ